MATNSSTLSAVAPDATFLLASGAEAIVASGMRTIWNESDVPWTSLYAAFADAHRDGAPILVGALPFDRERAAQLFQPARIARRPLASIWSEHWPVRAGSGRPSRWQAIAEPSAEDYQQRVSGILDEMLAQHPSPDALRKVVLARSLTLHADVPIDLAGVLRRLSVDPDVTVFAVPLPSAGGVARTLVGATPELLVDKTGDRVVSEPLAGSALRHADPAADRDAANALLLSEKDRREHAAVVEWIADRLSPYCSTLRVPSTPSTVSTRFVWHLGTRLEGTLKDESVSSLELADVLHPTPAVCGLPRDVARAAIEQFERFDRGFFAGAVGWCDTRGDGRWLMTLRCAEVWGRSARLYAGAGIVAGSDPYAERLETSAKLAALLEALEVDEQGHVTAPGDAR